MNTITSLENTENSNEIESALQKNTEIAIKTLNDAELLFVGGGSGTVIF